MATTETKSTATKKSEVKENPIAKEATAPKAEANPSKIEESKKQVEERKEADAARKPNHADLMNSMRKQTKKHLETVGPASRTRPVKPRSFPDPTFKPSGE